MLQFFKQKIYFELEIKFTGLSMARKKKKKKKKNVNATSGEMNTCKTQNDERPKETPLYVLIYTYTYTQYV